VGILQNTAKLLVSGRILFLWFASLLLCIITFLLVNTQRDNQQIIVLHYNVIVGAEVFGKAADLYKVPFIGFFVLGLNTVLYWSLKGKQNFLAESAIWISTWISAILLISLLFLRTVN